MNRRSFLGAGLVGFSLLSGCLSNETAGETTPTPNSTETDTSEPETPKTETETPTTAPEMTGANTTESDIRVSMTRTAPAGLHTKEFVIGENGELTYRLTCREGETIERSGSISDEEHRDFVALVSNADVPSLDEKYECSGSCPTDIPGKRYTFDLGGEEKSIYVGVQADGVPTDLQQIITRIDDFRERIETPTCDDVDGTTGS